MNVLVRLVPKSAQDISTDANIKQLLTGETRSPSADLAEYAEKVLDDKGLDAARDSSNGINLSVTEKQFENLFGTGVVRKQLEADQGLKPTRKSTFPTSATELSIPDFLQSQVAFAYLPTPPIFMDSMLYPPPVRMSYLRLEDVARILRATLCHQHGWTGAGIRVAMIDTGFAAHPYFVQNAYRITRIPTNLAPHPEVDDKGHGTAMAANLFAVAPQSELLAIKQGAAALDLERAMSLEPDIMVGSWGWDIDTASPAELRATNPNLYFEFLDVARTIRDAVAKNIVVVFAAGNGHYAFPASHPDVVAVGGVTVELDGRLRASSYASSFRSKLFIDDNRSVPDICGIVGEAREPNKSPEGHIMLPFPTGAASAQWDFMPRSAQKQGWAIASGTSAAAPQIAGIIALMLQINPTVSPAKIKRYLLDKSFDVEIDSGITATGDSADDDSQLAVGKGLADALGASYETLKWYQREFPRYLR